MTATLSTRLGNLGGASLGLVLLAEANLGAGRAQEGVDAAGVGIAIGEQLAQPFNEAQLLALQARGLSALDRHEEARAALVRGLVVAERMGARSAALQVALAFAELVGGDDPAVAASVLGDALDAMGDGTATEDQRAAQDLLKRRCVSR